MSTLHQDGVKKCVGIHETKANMNLMVHLEEMLGTAYYYILKWERKHISNVYVEGPP
jgi:hypothetical protein